MDLGELSLFSWLTLEAVEAGLWRCIPKILMRKKPIVLSADLR